MRRKHIVTMNNKKKAQCTYALEHSVRKFVWARMRTETLRMEIFLLMRMRNLAYERK